MTISAVMEHRARVGGFCSANPPVGGTPLLRGVIVGVGGETELAVYLQEALYENAVTGIQLRIAVHQILIKRPVVDVVHYEERVT